MVVTFPKLNESEDIRACVDACERNTDGSSIQPYLTCYLLFFATREMYRITEGLQREQASLIKQLDLLRYVEATRWSAFTALARYTLPCMLHNVCTA